VLQSQGITAVSLVGISNQGIYNYYTMATLGVKFVSSSRQCENAVRGRRQPSGRFSSLNTRFVGLGQQNNLGPCLRTMHSQERDISRRANESQESDGSSPDLRVPKRVCIMVEPSPFTYVCGYMNRYRNTIKYLTELGCEVLVVSPGKGVSVPGADTSAFVDQPEEYCGARVVEAFSFSFPWYKNLPLSFGLSPRIYKEIKDFSPDIIHCSSPGVMWFAALLYSRLLKAPLVYSYHTHVPQYMPNYNFGTWLVGVMWSIIRFFHKTAHLTLATSSVLADELAMNDAPPQESVDVWKKGVCSETFHPKYNCEKMRERLSEGHPDAPLLLSVGRLGSEKNLTFLKGILDRHPNARLAFVGDGPAREELEEYFAGTKTYFAGMLMGEDLAAAYASADIFLMPSESETLGFVVLEAMASGKPVVAVRAGGIPDILSKQGQTGFLYESGDLDTASSLVESLIEDAELRDTIGQAAREEVGLWDWRAATKHLMHVQYPAAMAAAALFYGNAVSNSIKPGEMIGKIAQA
jgi:sulfoquinovosyltransferase